MKSEELLTQGLQKGFAGGSTRGNVDRADFTFETGHTESDEGIYHDEWTGNQLAGGQEVARTNEDSITRVYAGGTIPIESLEALGIVKKDVIKALKKVILEHGSQIRLYEDFTIELEDEQSRKWKYEYKVIDRNPEIPLTTGKEIIYFGYDEKVVFVHVFSISPIES